MHRWLLAFLTGFVALPALAQKKDPEAALATLIPGDGLKVELFASEPMVVNPTSIDVDHKGRVWVAEAVNYRRKMFNRPILRKEGDRIQVLIDEKGEGKATKAVTFYQGEDLYGPLSVCVIPTGKGLRVLVAQSPDILEFTCKDADNPVADGPPKKFLTGFGGFDHDHGVHGLHLGPDGKLYFTVGDSGVKDLQSSDGQGKRWTSNTTDCQKGTAWRCDLDGKNLELIAHNFRNNYEACVDSFGEIWLSDNDDDGNEQTRICFVLPGGNYGYGPRGPGQSHWHEEQPGIVHKVFRTGFGSPTGIQFYEGNLLPKQYRNTLMHADAGPREIRAFTRKPKGAGYELDKAVMLTSTDNWFRPSDVCTAPDGSVFVADWYDPGVGGHGMGDWNCGRIYRLTPKDHKGYKVPAVDVGNLPGLFAALGSPCLTTRAIAHARFRSLTPDDEKQQSKQLDDPAVKHQLAVLALGQIEFGHPVFRSRLVMTQQISAHTRGQGLLREVGQMNVSRQPFPQLLSTYVRLTDAYLGQLPPEFADSLAFDYSINNPEPFADPKRVPIGLARDALILMRRIPDPKGVREGFYALAKRYDGQDIFYRAALNIACGTDPARRDAILADFEKHFPEWNDKVADLVWELRPKSMLPKLDALLNDAKLTPAQKARIVDILAASDDPAVGKTMLGLLKADQPTDVKNRAIGNLRLFLPTKWNTLVKSDELKSAITALLADAKTIPVGLQLASASRYIGAFQEVAAVASDAKQPVELRTLAVGTLGELNTVRAPEALEKLLADPAVSAAAVTALGMHISGRAQNSEADKKAMSVLQGLVTDDAAANLKQIALAALAGSRAGTGWLLKLKEDSKMPAALVADAGRLLRNSPFQAERNKAMLLFPAASKLDPTKLPPISELAKKVGSVENGKAVLAKSLTGEAQCLKCHMVRGVGGNIGPDLSMIGKKGSKENLYDSLLTPSKAIADQYVSWRLDAEDGQSMTGLLVEENAKTITVRDANGKDYTFPVKGTEKKKDAKSIMPEDVIKAFTEDELIDVVEYLMTLQTPSLTPDSWLVAGPFPAADDAALDKEFDVKPNAWRTIRSGANGYFDLAAFHGDKSPRSLSYLKRTIESPMDQEVTIRLGADDGCRLFVNGTKVLAHDRHEAASPDRDQVKVKLKKGANEVLLKINNGNNPHGFYLTIDGGVDLKVK
jgi:putative membrane-bound dehydrogenase-like protein